MFFYPELNGMKLNEVTDVNGIKNVEDPVYWDENGIKDVEDPGYWDENGMKDVEDPGYREENGIKHVEDPGYCNELTIIKEGGSLFDGIYGGLDYNIYVKCERQNQVELMRGHLENKNEFSGVLYCRGEEKTMIYVENDLIDREVKIWEVEKDPEFAGEKLNLPQKEDYSV